MNSNSKLDALNSKSSDLTIKKGVRVTLKGLKNASYLNGRTGMVTGDKNPTNGRFPIQVDGPYKSPCTGKATEDIISFKEENLVFNKKAQTCNGCFQQFDSKELRKCSKCRLVSYCSEKCQHNHWYREHKEDCKILRHARKSMKDKNSVSLPESKQDRVYFLQQRGLRFLQKKDLDAAEKDFRTLVETEQFHAISAYLNLGVVLMMQEKTQEALPYLEKAVTLPPLEDRNELRHAYDMLSTASDDDRKQFSC